MSLLSLNIKCIYAFLYNYLHMEGHFPHGIKKKDLIATFFSLVLFISHNSDFFFRNCTFISHNLDLFSNALSRPFRTYFTRWLIHINSYDLTCTILYDLSRPQWQVGIGAVLEVGHSYKFILIGELVKYIRFSKNHMNSYKWGRTNSYELATS